MSNREAWLSARYDSEKKSILVAYLLVFFGFGWLGAHRIYAGRVVSGMVMGVLGITGITLGVLSLGLLWLPFFVVLGPWILIDLVLLPGILQRHNSALADSYFTPASRREPGFQATANGAFRGHQKPDSPFAVRLHPSDRIGR